MALYYNINHEQAKRVNVLNKVLRICIKRSRIATINFHLPRPRKSRGRPFLIGQGEECVTVSRRRIECN